MGNKSTDAEIERRVSEVYTLILAGVRRADIVRHAAKNKWGVESRMIDTYIARATEELRTAATVDRDAELGRAIRRLHHLHQASQRDKDHRTSLSVQRDLTALLGLQAATKVDVSVEGVQDWAESIQAMIEKAEADRRENP